VFSSTDNLVRKQELIAAIKKSFHNLKQQIITEMDKEIDGSVYELNALIKNIILRQTEYTFGYKLFAAIANYSLDIYNKLDINLFNYLEIIRKTKHHTDILSYIRQKSPYLWGQLLLCDRPEKLEAAADLGDED
jgi:hypothetical protein